MELRVATPKRDQRTCEREQRAAVVVELPIDPADLVVLTIGVVVALLRPADLVAGAQHGNALREEQDREQVSLLPLAERANRRVVARALDAAIPAPVGVATVTIVLAIGLVVFALVADQIVQGEAVVRRHEVDARHRTSILGRVQIG